MFRFVELNADARTHKPALPLVVVGVAWLTDKGALTGKVKAYYSTTPLATRQADLPPPDQIIDGTFDGHRIDETGLDPLMDLLRTALPTGGRATPTPTRSATG
jgi:hypothetical protein